MARVVVGLSGGVDSSVAAALLKEQGHEVIGLFMRNWNDASVTLEDECPWIDDSRDAMLVAEKLGIPFQVLDLSEAYKARIVDYMFAEYQSGRTPNPDVLCNREIKFDLFLKQALLIGADFVATGHYVRKGEENGEFRLMSGLDPQKDQSYFLCQLSQEQLAKALFPIGEMLKSEVRAKALELDLVTAAKKDSQGLCFIGHVSLPEFLQQQLKPKKGSVIEISANSPLIAQWQDHYDPQNPSTWRLHFKAQDGVPVGEHNGAHFYTRGQRKGLQIGGKQKPLFVLENDVEANAVYVGQGEDHPALYATEVFIADADAHWVRPSLSEWVLNGAELQGRIRYRQALSSCRLSKFPGGYRISFEQPQKAIAAGQFAALYAGEELVFSGVMQ
ncbi:MAG: tRNA 2-thiouridine(34) synthase MnmA [Bacteroidia bacterium]